MVKYYNGLLVYSLPEVDGLSLYFQRKFPELEKTTIYLTQEDFGSLGKYCFADDVILVRDVPEVKILDIFAHEVAHKLAYLYNGEIIHGEMWTYFREEIYRRTGVLAPESSSLDTNYNENDFRLAKDVILQSLDHDLKRNINKVKETDDDTVIYVKRHRERVKYWMYKFVYILVERAQKHDLSKLEEPELSLWRKMDEKPRYPYSDDPDSPYQRKLKRHRRVFELHWQNNRHHPEFFSMFDKDALGADLIDIVEFLADQLGYRSDLSYSDASRLITSQSARFGFSSELEAFLLNTLRNYFLTFGGTSALLQAAPVDFQKTTMSAPNKDKEDQPFPMKRLDILV